jgi:hypothetical protein
VANRSETFSQAFVDPLTEDVGSLPLGHRLGCGMATLVRHGATQD